MNAFVTRFEAKKQAALVQGLYSIPPELVVIATAIAFAALLRVTLLTFPALGPVMTNILWVLAFLTMTVGNLSALLQDNLKRMLAWSSIAHAGYILVGLVAGDVAGGQAALFYLLVYAFMNLGAFGVMVLLAHKEDDGYDIGNVRGIGFRYPVLGGLLTLFLVSLAGIPPTAGFVGKFYLFGAAIKNGYVGLAVLGVLNSAVSVYYYLRPVVYMYMLPAQWEIPVPRPPRTASSLALCVCAAAVLVLGLAPASVLAFAEWSILSLQMWRETGHRGIFAAYCTAGENSCKAQALSGDIPARGGTFLVQPRMEGRSVLPLREGVYPAHGPLLAESFNPPGLPSISRVASRTLPG